jgi:FkbM family methyltransferase
MPQRRNILAKKWRTLKQLLRTRDYRELWNATRTNAWTFSRLYSPDGLRGFARLDGCRFSIRDLDPWIRGQLLDRTYELPERRALAKHLDPELPVIELGGCMGVVSCITNRRLTRPEAHVVVEPNPLAIPLITHNAKLNGCPFRVVNAAIAYLGPETTFYPNGITLTNRLDGPAMGPAMVVPNRTLGSLAAEYGFSTFTLICDIEGYEYELLLREPEAVEKARMVIIETHERYIGREKNQFVLQQLVKLGLKTLERFDNVLVMRK